MRIGQPEWRWTLVLDAGSEKEIAHVLNSLCGREGPARSARALILDRRSSTLGGPVPCGRSGSTHVISDGCHLHRAVARLAHETLSVAKSMPKILSRKSLLEQLKCIIIIEHLDGVCKCEQLLSAGLATLIPLSLLGGTALLQLSKELLVLKHFINIDATSSRKP